MEFNGRLTNFWKKTNNNLTFGGTGKMTAREHQFEVGTCLEEIKQFQDRVLDVYDPEDQKKIALLKELVSLQNELEDLEKEFESYIKENC